MEPDDEKTKKLNEDFVEFMRKRSDTETPRYTARLKTYLNFKRKRDRATAARRNYQGGHHEKTLAAGRKKDDDEQKDKGLEKNDHTGGDKERISRSSVKSVAGETSDGSFRPLQRRASSASSDAELDPFSVEPFLCARLPACPAVRDGDKLMPCGHSVSRSRSGEPSDRCGNRRRRRRRRRLRRSCRRRRRRRRSRLRRRRRRRSCRRRRSRRRRSCRRSRRRRRRRSYSRRRRCR